MTRRRIRLTRFNVRTYVREKVEIGFTERQTARVTKRREAKQPRKQMPLFPEEQAS
jgi:hypothetical protein